MTTHTNLGHVWILLLVAGTHNKQHSFIICSLMQKILIVFLPYVRSALGEGFCRERKKKKSSCSHVTSILVQRIREQKMYGTCQVVMSGMEKNKVAIREDEGKPAKRLRRAGWWG